MLRGWWLLFAVVPVAWAQDTAPQFEVASIKPNTSGVNRVGISNASPDRFRAENAWLGFLIQVAWDVRNFQIVGVPGWGNSARFDIEASTGGKATFAEKKLMLRSLLEERFQLKVHRETRQMPVYELSAAKGGLKLQEPAEGSCVKRDPGAAIPAVAPGEKPPVYCGNMMISPHGMRANGIPISQFLSGISDVLQRTVVDRTAFAGTFDVNVEWAQDQSTPGFFG